MDEPKIEIWYENHEGEVKSVSREVVSKRGETMLKEAVEIASKGMQIKSLERGIYRFIPPSRILSITYPE